MEENMNNGIVNFSMEFFPKSDHTIAIKDALYIDDNLDENDFRRAEIVEGMEGTPIKIMMALIFFCINGNIRCKINEAEVTLDKGSAIIVLPGAICEHMEFSEDCKIAVCAAKYDINSPDINFIPQKSLTEIGKVVFTGSNPAIFKLDEEFFSLLLTLYRTEREIFKKVKPAFLDDAIRNFLATASCILASSTQNMDKNEDIVINHDMEIFGKFIDNVHKYAMKERSVSFYADKACLSPKYFARLISKASGHKPGHWIKNHVILEAKTMLASGRYTIQQVSDNLNFPNPSFFCKYFKQETGHSPGHYQKGISKS